MTEVIIIVIGFALMLAVIAVAELLTERSK